MTANHQISTMEAKANTWSNYLKSNPKNDDANQNLESFAEATLDPNNDKIVKNLTEDPDSLFLSYCKVTEKMKLFHSPTNLGSTRCQESKD